MTTYVNPETSKIGEVPDRPAQSVLWTPHPGFQTKALQCAADEALLGGAAGPGKTQVLIILAARYATAHAQASVLFLRTVHKDLLEVLDRMHTLYPSMGFRWNASEGRWHHQGGGTILMAHASNMREASAFLGKQYTAVCWDEIGLLGDYQVWSELRTRLRTPAKNLATRMRCTANPGGPGHAWLKKRFVTPCGIDGALQYRDPETQSSIAYVPGRLSDNPSIDPGYRLKLRGGTELRRKQLEDGDWDAGEGLSFEMSRSIHWAPEAFAVPDHWTVFGAHDWGFAHYWSFGLFAADEDGTVYLVDSTSGVGDQPDAIVERVKRCVERQSDERDTPWGLERLTHTAAGHDIWNKRVAVGGRTPALVEQYQALGWYCVKANIGRVMGANNLRNYLAYKSATGLPKHPKLILLPTGHNERVWTALESRVSDPTDIEDVLKPKDGEDPDGLDDIYDMVRYGLASRPLAAVTVKAVVQGEAHRHPGYDYRTGTRKPNRIESAVKAYGKELSGRNAAWVPKMPAVGRTPSVARGTA